MTEEKGSPVWIATLVPQGHNSFGKLTYQKKHSANWVDKMAFRTWYLPVEISEKNKHPLLLLFVFSRKVVYSFFFLFQNQE
jgi:hypothetical protein